MSTEPVHLSEPAAKLPPEATTVLAWLALLVAGVAAAGSVYLSLGLNLKACTLCFYQRAFAFSALAVLAVGLIGRAARPGRVSLLALPLALAGLGVAAFHVSLEVRGTLECPRGLMAAGTAPQQSLAVLTLLSLLLFLDLVRNVGTGAISGTSLVLSLLMAGIIAVAMWWGSIYANPPLPKPDKPYTSELDTCRQPYRP